MRALEVGYSLGTLWFLRRVPPHEIMPERRALWTPERHHGGAQVVVHADDSSTSVEDDFSVKRKLSSSLDRAVLDV